MPTLTYALTTLAKVKLYLGISSTSDDALLEQLIDEVTVWIENYCGTRRFKETLYTNEVYDVKKGHRDVMLRNWPIIGSVSSVQQRTGTPSIPTWTNFTADDFVVYTNAGIIHFFGAFNENVAQALRFTYSAGYTTIPQDLELIANILIGTLFNNRKADGVKSESLEGHSISYANLSTEMLNAVQLATLGKYRRKLVGSAI